MTILPYNVAIIDFPWTYRNKKTGGNMTSGAQAQYDVMNIEDILAFPALLNEVLAEDCILAVWATTPLLIESAHVAFRLVNLGFEFKTKLYWLKDRKKLGIGHYFRNEVEELHIYTRGNVKPFRLAMKNIIEDGCGVTAPVGRHSEKPEIFQDILEHVGFGAFQENANFIECFARRQRDGWTCLGYDIDHTDIRSSLVSEAEKVQGLVNV